MNLDHPDLNQFRQAIFWDTKIEKIDWIKMKRAVIQRVFQRGNEKEKQEVIRFYGKAAVEETLKSNGK